MAGEELAGARVLVVEDELLIAAMIAELLEEIGCVVLGPVARLEDAVKAASEGAIDGAVLDVNLAGEAVFPVADALAGREIPFLFLTGYGAESLPASHGRRPTLRKPVRPDELLEALGGVIRHRRAG
jgi:CheY-like chemotaxis protein